MMEDERNFSGIWIPKIIYLDKSVNWMAKILFLEIHSFTQNGRECFMSLEYMSSFLKISERQVSRYVKELKSIGWIKETGFDGRKRYLQSCLSFDFRIDDPETTLSSSLPRQKCRGRSDIDVYHTNKKKKPNTKKNTFLKENQNKRGTTLG